MSALYKVVFAFAVGVAFLGVRPSPGAAETPQRGGTIRSVVEGGDPNTFDCHGATQLTVLQLVAPHYSLLLRYDAANYPKIVGDLAQAWTVSPDGLTYTFKLHSGVHFHDGSILTADDIKASYDRLRNPPRGVISARQTQFNNIADISVVDALTVSFKLTRPDTGALVLFADPWNCIYSARKLVQNPTYPATEVMGTGPFVFSEYVKGSHWSGKRFDKYFRRGMPYLDGFTGVLLSGAGVITAIAGGQVDLYLRGLSPQQRDRIRQGRGERVVFQTGEATTITMYTLNARKSPFNDPRVRRALKLAIDYQSGAANLRRISILNKHTGLFRTGNEYAASPAELRTLTGGSDIDAARAEAKKLLGEAGIQRLEFKVLVRDIQSPHQQLAIFLMDQWRRIGLPTNIEMRPEQTGPYVAKLRSGDYDVAIDYNPSNSDEPNEVLLKWVPGSDINYSGIQSADLTKLYESQRAVLDKGQRRQIIRDFEKRVFEDGVSIPLFDAIRITAQPSNFKNWHITPLYFVGHDFADAWLAP